MPLVIQGGIGAPHLTEVVATPAYIQALATNVGVKKGVASIENSAENLQQLRMSVYLVVEPLSRTFD